MSDTPERPTDGGVLRPFVEPEVEPLPVTKPAPPEPPAAPEPTPTEVADAASSVVVEEPEFEPTVSPVTDAPEPVESPLPDPPEPASIDTPIATEPPPGARGLTGADDSSPAALIPELGGSDSQTITMGRTPFFIGVAVVVAALIGLAALWQTAGGDSEPEPVAADIPVPVDSEGVVIDTSDTDALAAALAEQTERADGAEGRASELETQVSELEQRLQDQPIPALPARALERIIVNTDPQFISASDDSVAVVGPFGGYANIDPATNTVTASGQIGTEATRVLRTPTSVWATNFNGDELVRLNPVTNQIVDGIAFPGPDGLAKFGDSLLVASYTEGFVGQVNPGDGSVVAQADVGGNVTAVVAGEDWIYAAVFETGEVVKIDPETFEVVDRAIVGAGPIGLVPGAGERVWVANHEEGTVARVDFANGEIFSIPVGDGPFEVALALGYIWVAVEGEGELVQIDFRERAVVTRTPLGGEPTGLSVGDGSLWVAVGGDRSVVRVTI